MSHITRHVMNAVLEQMPAKFSSHEFIRRLMVSHSHAYVLDLLALFNNGTPKPLTSHHQCIGRRLLPFEKAGRIKRAGRPRSRNILGRTVRNQLWETV